MKLDDQSKQFLEQCKKVDFSSESVNREKNLEALKIKLKQIEREGEIKMNKKLKKPFAAVAIAATVVCFSIAAYGDELVRIVKSITVGQYANYYVIEDNRDPKAIPIPQDIKGQVFDKDGNELVYFPENGILYDESGKEVKIVYDDGKTRIMTDDEAKKVQKSETFEVRSIEEGLSYFITDALMPKYLPKGYAFDRMEYYRDPANKEENKQGSNKYINIYYSNGKDEIYSQVRYMDEETAFGTSVSKDVKRVNINGYEAIIDGKMLDIQIGDVMYMIFDNGTLGHEELIKIAQSLE